MEIVDDWKCLLSDDEERNAKFIPNFEILNEYPDNTQEILKLMNEYGINYDRDSLDIRMFTIKDSDLKDKLEKYKTAGYLNYFVNDATKLRYKADKIIDRIKTCEKAGKGFSQDGNLCSFIFNTNEWNAVLNGIDTTVTVATIESVFGDKADEIIKAISVEGMLDINGFDRYWKLTQLMGRCMESKYGISEIGDAELAIRNLICNSDLDDNNVILAAFVSSQSIKVEDLDDIKAIINEVIESDLKESHGVAL